MPERPLEGIHIATTPSAEQSIARTGAQLTAFVGRALRGPLNYPVTVRSFADFQNTFGGLWQPSPLSYAVEHFFEQGGRQAVIVRVANGAAPVTLSLACGREVLALEARAPGTREFLRASIDYDHIEATEEDRFNLVVQRVRSPGSERVEAQETFRGLSVDPEATRFVAAALLDSNLVRVRGIVPTRRPDRTLMPGTNLPVGYVSSNPDGDDGRPLSDYDVIGSAPRRTGIFALAGVEDLSLLYVPPLARMVDVGVSTLLVAARFCRDRRAMLIVDPPANWDRPADAIRGLAELNLYSDHAMMFFPRLATMDRLRGRTEVFGNGGAVAGLLSRSGEVVAAAVTAPEPEPLLRTGARLASEVSPAERRRLATHGINVLRTVRTPDRNYPLMRTLASGASASADWSYLSQRRFALFIVNAIERGTRWAGLEPRDPAVWHRVAAQVRTFLGELRAAGAFASVREEQAFLVICDGRINGHGEDERGELNLLIQFAAIHAGEYHSFMITHSIRGSTVRTVAVNRLEATLVADDLEQEITIRVYPEDDDSPTTMVAS